MGSIVGHRIDYNGVGSLRGQRHIPSKTWPKYPTRVLSWFELQLFSYKNCQISNQWTKNCPSWNLECVIVWHNNSFEKKSFKSFGVPSVPPFPTNFFVFLKSRSVCEISQYFFSLFKALPLIYPYAWLTILFWPFPSVLNWTVTLSCSSGREYTCEVTQRRFKKRWTAFAFARPFGGYKDIPPK